VKECAGTLGLRPEQGCGCGVWVWGAGVGEGVGVGVGVTPTDTGGTPRVGLQPWMAFI
jgi:hypothetical protein